MTRLELLEVAQRHDEDGAACAEQGRDYEMALFASLASLYRHVATLAGLMGEPQDMTRPETLEERCRRYKQERDHYRERCDDACRNAIARAEKAETELHDTRNELDSVVSVLRFEGEPKDTPTEYAVKRMAEAEALEEERDAAVARAEELEGLLELSRTEARTMAEDIRELQKRREELVADRASLAAELEGRGADIRAVRIIARQLNLREKLPNGWNQQDVITAVTELLDAVDSWKAEESVRQDAEVKQLAREMTHLARIAELEEKCDAEAADGWHACREAAIALAGPVKEWVYSLSQMERQCVGDGDFIDEYAKRIAALDPAKAAGKKPDDCDCGAFVFPNKTIKSVVARLGEYVWHTREVCYEDEPVPPPNVETCGKRLPFPNEAEIYCNLLLGHDGPCAYKIGEWKPASAEETPPNERRPVMQPAGESPARGTADECTCDPSVGALPDTCPKHHVDNYVDGEARDLLDFLKVPYPSYPQQDVTRITLRRVYDRALADGRRMRVTRLTSPTMTVLEE